jgi:hypothetical protein
MSDVFVPEGYSVQPMATRPKVDSPLAHFPNFTLLAVAVSSALTRVMAIPTVNAWLGRVGMSATPSTTPAVDPPAPLPPADPIVSSEGVTYSSDTKADAADYDPKHDRED